MTDRIIQAETLQDIADAIRAKKGTSEPIAVTAFASEIGNIETSGGGSGGGLAINGIIEQYKVNAGATVNAGDFVEFVKKFGNGTFSSNAVSYVSACKLDDRRVLVTYCDGGNSNYGTAVVLYSTNTGVTVGTPVVFCMSNTSYLSAVALNEDKVLVAYRDGGNSNYGTAIVLTINGTVITYGTATAFQSAHTQFISAVALSENKVLVAYGNVDNGYYGTAIVLTINGTVITHGAATTFKNKMCSYLSAVALNEDKVLVAYRQSNGSAIVLTISGTTITAGASVTFKSSDTSYLSAVALSENKVLVVYADYAKSNYGTAIVLMISGTAITYGTAVVFETSASNNYMSAVALTDSKVLVTYRDTGNSNHGTAVVLTISGTAVTVGAATIFNNTAIDYPSAFQFSSSSACVAYNNATGAFTNLSIDGTAITAGEVDTATYVKPATSRNYNVGVAATSGAEGETVDVYVVG